MKTLKQLEKQKTYSREDVLTILSHISKKVSVESFNRILDVQEELGYGRYEDEALTD